jgi:hypothetical protein
MHYGGGPELAGQGGLAAAGGADDQADLPGAFVEREVEVEREGAGAGLGEVKDAADVGDAGVSMLAKGDR